MHLTCNKVENTQVALLLADMCGVNRQPCSRGLSIVGQLKLHMAYTFYWIHLQHKSTCKTFIDVFKTQLRVGGNIRDVVE